MTENKLDEPASDVTTHTPPAEILPDEDLQEVAGGGTIGDIYDALNESWTDIKRGFMDAWTD